MIPLLRITKVPEPTFKLDFVYNTDLTSRDFKYGALARDGVSCASCHHIVKDHTPPGQDPLQYFLNHYGSGASVVRYEIPMSQLPKGIDASKLTVKAALYYQSIPPYYLMQRFEQAPNAPGTRRLFYLASRLNTRGTPI